MTRRRLHRGGRRAALIAVAAAAWAVVPPAAEAGPASQQLAEFLDAAGWPARTRGALDLAQPADVVRLVLRLQGSAGLLADAADESDGAAEHVRGTIVATRALPLSSEDRRALGELQPSVCDVRLDGGQAITLVTLRTPDRWRLPGVLPQPIEADTLRVGGDRPLWVAPAVRWRPTAPGPGVNLGASLLGQLGVDLLPLDSVADGKPLRRADYAPFYSVIAAARQVGAHQLVRFADRNLEAFAHAYHDPAESPPPRPGSLAAMVTERAQAGAFAWAPLLLKPDAHRGELVVFDGLVRRCVRIDCSIGPGGGPSRAKTEFGLGHYFELELFTNESLKLGPKQSLNPPLVFCVAELPAGFPRGDRVQQPARLAGFFFKRWVYRTRKRGPDGTPGKPEYAPLLIGRAPIPLASKPGGGGGAAVAAGGFFVAALLAVWVTTWLTARGDRAFETRVRSRLSGIPPASEADVQQALAALREPSPPPHDPTGTTDPDSVR